MFEPRGHENMYGVLKVPIPGDQPGVDMAVLFMHNEVRLSAWLPVSLSLPTAFTLALSLLSLSGLQVGGLAAWGFCVSHTRTYFPLDHAVIVIFTSVSQHDVR